VASRRKQQVHIKDEEFRSVCSAARSAYLAKGSLPTLDEINAVCDVPRGRIAKVMVQPEFVQVMEATGINWRLNKGLTAKQHYVLQIMTNPTDKRSFADRLKDAGVTYVEYKSWMRQPAFASLIENFAQRALGDHLTVAHDSLLKQVEKGNTRALEFYYEMTGVYSKGSQQERDVQAVLTGVIDIIHRNVKDPDVLSSIASEIKVLMGGPVSTPMALTAFRDEMGTEEAQWEDVEIPTMKQVKDPTGSLVDFEPIPNIIPPVAKQNIKLTFDGPNLEE
jgi:hypothetical protein